MTKIRSLIVIAAVVLAYSGVASSVYAQETAAGTRTGQSSASLADGTAIKAELNSSIDSKKAKAGDAVTAHTTEALKSADDRTILPKGTKIAGPITQAAARSKGDSESVLGIGFDKAILKGGEEVPLRVKIQALAAPASSSSALDMGAPGPDMPSNRSGSSPMSGSRSTRPDGTAGYPSSSPTANDTSSEARSIGGTDSSGQLAPDSKGVFGLSGLHLSTAPSNNAQESIVSSNGKNVHLDSGTRLLLVTQIPASGAPGQ